MKRPCALPEFGSARCVGGAYFCLQSNGRSGILVSGTNAASDARSPLPSEKQKRKVAVRLCVRGSARADMRPKR